MVESAKLAVEGSGEVRSLKVLVGMYREDLLRANACIKEYEDSIQAIQHKAASEVEARLLSFNQGEEAMRTEVREVNAK
jgi:hypothetical protein